MSINFIQMYLPAELSGLFQEQTIHDEVCIQDGSLHVNFI